MVYALHMGEICLKNKNIGGSIFEWSYVGIVYS